MHLYWSLFFNEVTRHRSTTLCKRYMITIKKCFKAPNAYSEIRSIKACKLCVFYINQLSQQARRLKRQKKVCAGAKKRRFILSYYSFKGKESSPI